MRFSFQPRRSVSRWLQRRRAAGKRLILLYHRIAVPEHDPFALSVAPSRFADHLDILRRSCQTVPLDELLDSRTTSRSILASVTFDDGYLDNLTTALPLLQQAGVPATFFICTGYLGDVRGFWWDRVATAIAAADSAVFVFELPGGLSLTGDLRTPDARRLTTQTIAGRLEGMPPSQRDRVVDEIEKVLLSRSSRARELCPVLDEAGVRELGTQPFAQLGAHTHGHPKLSALTREEQTTEINRGAALLRTITGTRPRFVAYPYGSAQDYNEDSCLAVRTASLDAAFVNHGAPFDPERSPYRIPRSYVPALSADDFRGWLQQAVAT